MTDAPKTWHDVLTTTRQTLPWREEEGGKLVLGDTFDTAPREAEVVEEKSFAPLPQNLALPAGEEASLPTPEQAYGTLVHAALQGLPLVAPEALRTRAKAEADAVRTALPWVWNADSRAEVALVLPNGQIGRTDRLVPHEGTLWVIDFKTGTPEESVPVAYKAQLQGYAQALAASLPNETIRAAIVWTASATLAEVVLSR